MQFYRKKARSMGVPIVPMIDILTILLIFYCPYAVEEAAVPA